MEAKVSINKTNITKSINEKRNKDIKNKLKSKQNANKPNNKSEKPQRKSDGSYTWRPFEAFFKKESREEILD